MAITFDNLPSAVAELLVSVKNIEMNLEQIIAQSSRLHSEPDCWFNITELCEYLPDKPVIPTVYGWVHARSIPFHKRGKKLSFLKSEIDSWIREGRRKTVVEAANEAAEYIAMKGGRK